jgi:hypothetical protein
VKFCKQTSASEFDQGHSTKFSMHAVAEGTPLALIRGFVTEGFPKGVEGDPQAAPIPQAVKPRLVVSASKGAE